MIFYHFFAPNLGHIFDNFWIFFGSSSCLSNNPLAGVGEPNVYFVDRDRCHRQCFFSDLDNIWSFVCAKNAQKFLGLQDLYIPTPTEGMIQTIGCDHDLHDLARDDYTGYM
jgi:hypothetical protein